MKISIGTAEAILKTSERRVTGDCLVGPTGPARQWRWRRVLRSVPVKVFSFRNPRAPLGAAGRAPPWRPLPPAQGRQVRRSDEVRLEDRRNWVESAPDPLA